MSGGITWKEINIRFGRTVTVYLCLRVTGVLPAKGFSSHGDLAPDTGVAAAPRESCMWSTDTATGESGQIVLWRRSHEHDELIATQTLLEVRKP